MSFSVVFFIQFILFYLFTKAIDRNYLFFFVNKVYSVRKVKITKFTTHIFYIKFFFLFYTNEFYTNILLYAN